MSFAKRIKKVHQAEDAVAANERQVAANLRQLKDSWISIWTPGRIVIAGLTSGFLVGHAEPMRVVAHSSGVLRSASALMTLVSGVAAAVTTGGAPDDAEAGGAAGNGTTPPPPAANTNTDNAKKAAKAAAAAEQLRHQANERVAHDYLERVAAAARQTEGSREP